jgi:hypothetical protein
MRAAFSELLRVRDSLKKQPGRTQLTAVEYYSLLRAKSPDLPEWPKPRLAADSPDNLPWPDNCGAWLDVAILCYETALADYEAGDRGNGALHEAEGTYAQMQGTTCLEVGF